jgi:hypothetical protein
LFFIPKYAKKQLLAPNFTLLSLSSNLSNTAIPLDNFLSPEKSKELAIPDLLAQLHELLLTATAPLISSMAA